jgi:hypothetical protein
VALLAACSKPAPTGPTSNADDAKRSAPDAKAASATPISVPRLAYIYTYDVAAPGKALPDLMAHDQKACQDAGPALCQITSATLTRDDDDHAEGRLALRAAPAWLTSFREGLGPQAKAAGGKLASTSVQTEDLTRQIVDTEAAVRAKTALRDRLQQMLETRPGKLSDVLDVEKELAQVQGELDATQSELAVMRERTETSVLTINYQSAGGFAARGAWAPLALAWSQGAGALASSLAALLTLAIVLGPWALAAAAPLS